MQTKVVTVQINPGKMDAAVRLFRELVVPAEKEKKFKFQISVDWSYK
jgi:uncharacterized cupredoxin-like copper-binding protein